MGYMVIAAALLACATTVHPLTMERIIIGESGGNPLAINVNRWSGAQPRPENKDQAIAIAQQFITAGYSVDLGRSQVNSRNLPGLEMTVADAFDDCKNVAAGGSILTAFYRKAALQYGAGQTALNAAISAYNTGNFFAGFTNGYVARITGSVPALRPAVSQVAAAAPAPRSKPDPFSADTQVYIRVAYNVSIQ